MGAELRTMDLPVSAKLMISYSSCLWSCSNRISLRRPRRRCSTVLRAPLDTGRLSVGRWLRCSLSRMLFLAKSRSSSRWLSRSKVASQHAGHGPSVWGFTTVAGVRNRRARSKEEGIAGGWSPYTHKSYAQGLSWGGFNSVLGTRDPGRSVPPAGMTPFCQRYSGQTFGMKNEASTGGTWQYAPEASESTEGGCVDCLKKEMSASCYCWEIASQMSCQTRGQRLEPCFEAWGKCV